VQEILQGKTRDVIAATPTIGRLHDEAADRVRPVDIKGARNNIQQLFNIDIAVPLTADEWKHVVKAFQKRHLIAHKMGIVDDGPGRGCPRYPAARYRCTKVTAIAPSPTAEAHRLTEP